MLVTGLGQAVLVIPVVFYTLAIASVGLRFCGMRIRERPWKLHDTLILVALACGLAQLVSVFYEVLQGGLGQHIYQLNTPQIESLFKGFTAHSVSWIFATNIAKLSVLAFYLDIFNIRISFRRFTYGFMAFIAVYGVASMLCVFTICRPFRTLWDKTIPGHCGNIMSAMFATAIINTVEDFIVIVMPMPILWSLQLPKQKKLGLMALLGFGFFICAINIARLGFARTLDESDASYNQAYQTLFMNLEVQLGIINACVPTMKPLFTRRKGPVDTSPPYSEYSNGPSPKGTIGSDKMRKMSRESDEQLLFTKTDRR